MSIGMKKLIFGPRMWILLILTVLVFGALFALQWYGKKMMNEAMNNAGPQSVTVSSAVAEVVTWQPTVSAVGTVRAIQGAGLSTEASGIVATINFDNGVDVEAGDTILTLASDTDRAQLAAFEAAAKLAEIELERARTLLKQRSLSQSEADRRQSELDQARANVETQKARIEEKTLRAPYDGRLGIRHVNVGDFVSAGDPIITLQSLDPLYVNFTLPEQYSSSVSPGVSLDLRVEALSGELFEGEITAVSPLIDPDTRNFAVQATVSNPEQRLKPGMFAAISLPIGEERTEIAIPQTAVSFRPYGNSVFVISKSGDARTVSQRFVTLGARRGDMVAVTDGLDEGEVVATSAILKLRSGIPVTIDNSVTPNASLTPAPENG